MNEEVDDRPISVRLGEVVPPEDPEDWTRPLTWVAALGMLAAPIVAFAWFATTPPGDATHPHLGTWLVAAVMVAGAVATGLTQRGPWRSATATIGAALFAAVATVAVGFSFTPEPPGIDPPAIAILHAGPASVAGVFGSVAAAPVIGITSRHRDRVRLGLAALVLGIGAGALVVGLVMPPVRPF